MDFFQWIQEGDQSIVSPYLWIYAAVTLLLTLMTVGLFYCYNARSTIRTEAKQNRLPV